MRRTKTMNVFPVVITVGLSAVNLLHLLWTAWLTVEQLRTGWGWGTGIEMAALALWLTELVCTPVLLLGIVYFLVSVFRRQKRSLLIANLSLYICAVVQIAITNLFLLY